MISICHSVNLDGLVVLLGGGGDIYTLMQLHFLFERSALSSGRRQKHSFCVFAPFYALCALHVRGSALNTQQWWETKSSFCTIIPFYAFHALCILLHPSCQIWCTQQWWGHETLVFVPLHPFAPFMPFISEMVHSTVEFYSLSLYDSNWPFISGNLGHSS